MLFPSRDLTNQFISLSYQDVVQTYTSGSASLLLNGFGNSILYIPTSSIGNQIITIDQSASYSVNALSASYAITTTLANVALVAEQSLSSSFADTASFALTASITYTSSFQFIVSSSFASESISSSYSLFAVSASHSNISDSSISSSYAGTASLLLGSIESASYSNISNLSYNSVSSSFASESISSSRADSANSADSITFVPYSSYNSTQSLFSTNSIYSISSSFSSGSIQSLYSTQSIISTSSLYTSQSIYSTQSLFATNSIYTISASWISSSSHITNADTASYISSSATFDKTVYNCTASWANNSIISSTSNYASQSQWNVSSSFASSSVSASYIDAGNITTGTISNSRLPDQINITGVTASFLIKGPFQDIKAFGAIGNGIALESTAIQTAINSGSVTYIPAGTYIIDNTLTLPSNHTLLMDNGALLKASQSLNKSILQNADQINGNINITIVGGTIDGNRFNQTSNSETVYFNKVSHSLIQNFHISNSYTAGVPSGIDDAALYIYACYKIDIIDCRSDYNYGTGLSIGSCSYVNVVRGNYVSNSVSGLDTTYSPYTTVRGVYAAGNGSTGISINSKRSSVVDCISELGGFVGINVGHTDIPEFSADETSVMGNISRNNGTIGIQVQGARTDKVQILGNNAYDNGWVNILLPLSMSGCSIGNGGTGNTGSSQILAPANIYLNTPLDQVNSMLTFKQNNSTYIDVDQSGNAFFGKLVGIGNTPQANQKLHISASNCQDAIVINQADDLNSIKFLNAGIYKWLMYLTGSNLGFYDTATRLVLKQGGNVGIGVFNPSCRLHLYSDDVGNDSVIIDRSTENQNYLKYSVGGVFKWVQYLNNNDLRFFGPTSLDVLTLSGSGNVGINNTTPTEWLSVKTAVSNNYPTLGTGSGILSLLGQGGGYGLFLGIHGSGNPWLQSMRNDGTASVYNIILQPQGGNVGIGTTSPGALLHVQGNISCSNLLGTASYASTSSFIGSGTNNYVPKWSNNTLTATSKIYDDGTNVGIGTTSPGALLHVQGPISASSFGSGSLQGTSSFSITSSYASTSPYVDRGFLSVSDYTTTSTSGQLLGDGNQHVLDLSSKIASGTKLVLFRLSSKSNTPGKFCNIVTSGSATTDVNVAQIIQQVAGIYTNMDTFVTPDSTGKVAYWTNFTGSTAGDELYIIIKGYST